VPIVRRLLMLSLLTALAIASTGARERVYVGDDAVASLLRFDGRPGSTATDAVTGAEAPLQVAAVRSTSLAASIRGSSEGTGPDTRVTDGPTSLRRAQHHPSEARAAAAPAVGQPLPGVEHRAILLRTGAISSFATSLPPPSFA